MRMLHSKRSTKLLDPHLRHYCYIISDISGDLSETRRELNIQQCCGHFLTSEPQAADDLARQPPRKMGSPYASPALSEESIRSLIHFRGGLPVEHRMIAWKYLLQLPSNSGAFTRQVSKGPYPAAFASLSERYPLRDRRLFRKMAVIVSSLAHWSPILADVEFLPSWVFPFVVVFFQVKTSLGLFCFAELHMLCRSRAQDLG